MSRLAHGQATIAHLTPVASLPPAEVLVCAIWVRADPVSLLASSDGSPGASHIPAATTGPRSATASAGSPAHLLLLHCSLDLHLQG